MNQRTEYARIFGSEKYDRITFQLLKKYFFSYFLLVSMPIISMLNILYYIWRIALINRANSIELQSVFGKTFSISTCKHHDIHFQFNSFVYYECLLAENICS